MSTRTTRLTIASLARELDRSTLRELEESARDAGDLAMARTVDRALDGSNRAVRTIARMALRGDIDLRLLHGMRVATRPGVCLPSEADEGTAFVIENGGQIGVAWDQGVTTYCPAADLIIL